MRVLCALLITITMITSAFAISIEDKFLSVTMPITFCSIYGRLVIDRTELIKDEKTKEQFYTLENNANLALKKFIEINNVTPVIEYKTQFLQSVKMAMETFEAESEVGKKNQLMSERFLKCQKILFNSFKDYEVMEHFKQVFSLKKPIFNMSAPLEPVRPVFTMEA